MSDFGLYLQLGFKHIADLNAVDHMVFLLALSARYKPSDWKKLLWLITAFTIGHSITLLLSTLNLILVPSKIIEFLIPVTILLTCIYNLIAEPLNSPKRLGKLSLSYILTCGFGLIHGMGFSNYLKQILGQQESITSALFGFNIGLEIGQLLIVGALFLFLIVFQSIITVSHRDWNIFISGCATGISLLLISNTVFW